MAVSNICASTQFVLMYLLILSVGLSMQQYRTRTYKPKPILGRRQVLTAVNDGFETFRKTMVRNIPGANEAMLNTREVREWYEKEFRNMRIDLNEPTHKSRIVTQLLSMLCAACRNNCTCLRQLGCVANCN